MRTLWKLYICGVLIKIFFRVQIPTPLSDIQLCSTWIPSRKSRKATIRVNKTCTFIFIFSQGGQGHFQTWNVQFWGFYKNFVLFQSKAEWEQSDLNDPNSFVIIGENFASDEIRKNIFVLNFSFWKLILQSQFRSKFGIYLNLVLDPIPVQFRKIPLSNLIFW